MKLAYTLCALNLCMLLCIGVTPAAAGTFGPQQHQEHNPQIGPARGDLHPKQSSFVSSSNSNASLRSIASSTACTAQLLPGPRITPTEAAQEFAEVTKFIIQNQLLLEGISPLAGISLPSITSANGSSTRLVRQYSSGSLFSAAASWVHLYRSNSSPQQNNITKHHDRKQGNEGGSKPPSSLDVAACSLASSVQSWASSHPQGPQLLVDSSILAEVASVPFAWQPQGFYFAVSSAKRGTLYRADRAFDNGNRPSPIRSATKAITAATFMALVDQGVFKLDDPASKYVPAFATQELSQITFRQLLSHTSGLPAIKDRGRALLDPNITLVQAAELVAKDYPLAAKPGTKFAYTELGYQVVCAAMVAATGTPYTELVRRYITGPLQMDQTQIFNQQSKYPSTNPQCATGGIASPRDTATLLSMLVGGGTAKVSGQAVRVLSPASAREIISPQPVGQGIKEDFEKWLSVYIEPMAASGLLPKQAAETMVQRGPWQPPYGYGLGTLLAGVRNGRAESFMFIGSGGTITLVANAQSDDTVMMSAAAFQYLEAGLSASAALMTYFL